MRRSLFALPLFAISLVLAGCENMDPAYWFPDNKKKLPGERREVFPEGIPGVVQGVPAELVRGNPANQPEGQAVAAPEPAPEPVQERPKSRPKKVVRPIQPPPEPEPQQAQTRPRQQQPQAAQQQQQQQQQSAPSSSGWPAPPAAGTFTR